MLGDRPRAAAWIAVSAIAGALGGWAFPEPPSSSFLSAALVGLAQGLLLRRWLDWWSWALATMIAGGAALALARAFAGLDADEIQAGDVAGLARIAALSGMGGALIGASQLFLLSSRYRRAAAWLPASAIAAALFWTASAMMLVALQQNASPAPMLGAGMTIAAVMAVSWGGLAAGTSIAMRQLKLQSIR
jgi:hypothetical protein